MKARFYFTRLFILSVFLLGVNFSSFSQTSTFNYTGDVQTWTVPAGVTSLMIDAQGAGGGQGYGGGGATTPGNGGRVQAVLSVTAGQVLNIYTGGQGAGGSGGGGAAGGFNGGGNAAGGVNYYSGWGGGSGGGASDIRIGGTDLPNRIIIAAGGGGSGVDAVDMPGGDGGGLTGASGASGEGGTAATGGTQSAGGTGGIQPGYSSGNDGSSGTGGDNVSGGGIGGGGGGGYFGGGGGSWGGGGGGSSFTDPTLVTSFTHTPGFNNSNGVVTVTVLNYAPTFANGSPQSTTVCENGSVDISSLLAVNDNDAGQTETWSVTSGPSNGTVGGFPYITTSTGGTLTPTGLSYIPNTGFTGTDAFTVQVDDGNGGTATTTINVTVNGTPSVSSAAIAAACAGATSTTLSYTDLINTSAVNTFSYSGSIQSWTVPAGVTSINITANGAQGGNGNAAGGMGAMMSGSFTVIPGHVLNIITGQQPGDGTFTGGGGGGSFVWDSTAGNILLIAAGGGGGGGFMTDANNGIDAVTTNDATNGGGGALYGGAGTSGNGGNTLVGTCAGTYAAGGAGWLTNGAGGNGGDCSTSGGGQTPLNGGAGGAFGGSEEVNGPGGFGGGGGSQGQCSWTGGGGGGGYSGGGGGDYNCDFAGADPGGGGGSFNIGDNQSNSVGNTGNGLVVISYNAGIANITWDSTAHAQGFTDITNDSIYSSPVTIPVSGTAVPATYNGTLTISNATCTSAGIPVSITINPIPTVDPVGSQTVCNTASTTEIDFTGSVPATTFNWTNDNTNIGLAASDSGNILSFTATNGTFAPIMGDFTVTPVANGCTGSAQTFTITVNPSPDVAPSSNQTVCNGTMTTTVIFTGDVPGTVFTWTNSDTTIGLAATDTGNIDSFTGTNITPNPVTASILVTTAANGCAGTSNSFTITVEPTPILSGSLNADAICDSTVFSYDPNSLTEGTTFSWVRDSVAGILPGATSGADNPNETLVNTTSAPIAVTYVYTLTGPDPTFCTNTQIVTVTVNPRPTLSSTLTPAAICDSTMFTYVPASATAGTAFSWVRDSVAGISDTAASDSGAVNEILVNTTPNPVAVNYVYTLVANTCSNTQTVVATVNPRPMLSTTLTPSPVCDSTLFVYVPASATTGTAFTWSRGVITGISNPAAHGADTISETLINTTANPVPVIYMDTLTANGCSNVQSITVTVNPKPLLSSPLTPAGICDSITFNYTPTSATVGTTFAWTRPYVLGLGLATASGTGNPDEQLINTTNDNLDVTYDYTLTANGCSNTEDVVVVVHPTPTLSSPLSDSVCSGADLMYFPTGYVFGSSFTWSRSHVAGISPASQTGTDSVNETLTDSLTTSVVVTYNFVITANGCPLHENVLVTVNPSPAAMLITTHPPATLCANTLYQNFGTSSVPPAGMGYRWSATNATLWATGTDGQYALVSFPNSGTAVVTLQSDLAPHGCAANSSFQVNVGSGVSSNPEVIYYNGQFLCLENSDTYQWGYDDIHTLDSTLVPGEVNQTYFISAPDFSNRYYWVMATSPDGCMQKAYYNAPTGVTNVNSNMTEVKVYPNPTNDYLNVDINTTVAGNVEVQVLNMLGQKFSAAQAVNNRARIDVAGLPSGVYLIDCYREGVKIAAARFIKN